MPGPGVGAVGPEERTNAKTEEQSEQGVRAEEVERVLAVGQLLLSILTPDELETIRETLSGQQSEQSNK